MFATILYKNLIVLLKLFGTNSIKIIKDKLSGGVENFNTMVIISNAKN